MTLYGTVTNLSAGGFFLRTLPIVDIGSTVDIKLSLDNGVVLARGEVMWTNRPIAAGGGSPGLGISLRDLREGGEILDRFVRRVSLVPEPE